MDSDKGSCCSYFSLTINFANVGVSEWENTYLRIQKRIQTSVDLNIVRSVLEKEIKPYLTDCIAEENVRAPVVTKIEAITDFVGFG